MPISRFRVIWLEIMLLIPLGLGAFPELKGKDLNGLNFNLQETIAQRPTVLVFGFSRAAGTKTKIWDDALLADFGTDTRVAIVDVVMLGKAPFFVRPMIKRSIRQHTAASRQSAVIVVEGSGAEWEAYFAERLKENPDSPFILAVFDDGKVGTCEVHGDYSAATDATFLRCLKSKLKNREGLRDAH